MNCRNKTRSWKSKSKMDDEPKYTPGIGKKMFANLASSFQDEYIARKDEDFLREGHLVESNDKQDTGTYKDLDADTNTITSYIRKIKRCVSLSEEDKFVLVSESDRAREKMSYLHGACRMMDILVSSQKIKEVHDLKATISTFKNEMHQIISAFPAFKKDNEALIRKTAENQSQGEDMISKLGEVVRNLTAQALRSRASSEVSGTSRSSEVYSPQPTIRDECLAMLNAKYKPTTAQKVLEKLETRGVDLISIVRSHNLQEALESALK